MRDIDEKIKALPQVIYYARYVDDIIVIFMPSIMTDDNDYKSMVKCILLSKGLTMNESDCKTKLVDLSDRSKNTYYDFDYLGYRFISGCENNKYLPLILTISTKKRSKYVRKLYKAFTLYLFKSKQNEKKARKIIVKRINFITSNVKLVNNKKNVLTGIFYSNSMINTKRDLEKIDRFYQYLLKKLPIPITLKRRLESKYSFVSGFDSSQVKRFKETELSLITQGWNV